MARRYRALTREEAYRVRVLAAHRHAGHHYWRWYVFGPHIRRIAGYALAAVALMYGWWRVPHIYLGAAALVLGAVLGVGGLVWQLSDRALQQRMATRATGGAARPAFTAAYAVTLVACFGVAFLALWSPYR